ncbi:DNA recombination protein RmuC [Allobaculum mucilyticum]|uniref:DNA recombination protein RmuC n=1 Tax=Allobaculum mucilyticum TaxID=2834459 RepID=UPI001E332595|nr:DNA recombination protein RmuC [Allobaculum mucilyticum]UNT95119.1 DNA recombination protein RmuC [Allobaculum mucilyticum]
MNGLIMTFLVIVILLLGFVGYWLWSISQELGTTFSSMEREQIKTDASLKRMGSQIERMSGETANTLMRSNDIAVQMKSVTDVMANAKKRGTWGEYQLETIVRTYLGNNSELFSTQFHLENGKIADGAFHLPQTSEVLCIDSKFPMENYLKIDEDPQNAEYHEKEFRKNIKKHIEDVSSKYITSQTVDEALLFIPSEAVYAWICGEGADLLPYALERHVLFVSPTTLCGVIFSLSASTRSFFRARNMASFEKQVRELEDRAQMLCEQAAKASRTSSQLSRQLFELQNSAETLLSQIERSADPVYDDGPAAGNGSRLVDEWLEGTLSDD